jgi:hypothetical protein
VVFSTCLASYMLGFFGGSGVLWRKDSPDGTRHLMVFISPKSAHKAELSCCYGR